MFLKNRPLFSKVQPLLPAWKENKERLKKVISESKIKHWAPERKISRAAMETLKEQYKADPKLFSVSVLAEKYKISFESVRRIIKSNFVPAETKRAKENAARMAKIKTRDRWHKEQSIIHRRSPTMPDLQKSAGNKLKLFQEIDALFSKK